MDFDVSKFKWINKPNSFSVKDNEIIITTEPETDLWQRTYYGHSNDTAHAFVMSIDVDFTFTVKAQFKYEKIYDQCGVIIYQDNNNWFKASIEFENGEYQRLGSVVT